MYSVFGSSRQLAVGPVAVTSLLIGNGIKAIVPGSQFITDPNNLDSFQLQASQTAGPRLNDRLVTKSVVPGA